MGRWQGLSPLTVWGFTTEQVQDHEAIKYLIKKDALAMAETQLSTLPGLTFGYKALLGNLEGKRGSVDLRTHRHWSKNKERPLHSTDTLVWHSLSCSAGNRRPSHRSEGAGWAYLRTVRWGGVGTNETGPFQFIHLKNLFSRGWAGSVLLLPQWHTQQQLVTNRSWGSLQLGLRMELSVSSKLNFKKML